MIDQAHRRQIVEELIRSVASAVRSVQLYAPTHPLVGRNVEALADALRQMHASSTTVTIGFVGDEIVVGDVPLPKPGASLVELARRLKARGIERVAVDHGVTNEEVLGLVVHLAESGGGADGDAGPDRPAPDWPHVRVGRIMLERRVEAPIGDSASVRRLYTDTVAAVETMWRDVGREGTLDAQTARAVVQGLAQAVTQSPAALLALTAMKNYDNYTFTHMVNVSVLTMAQARSLGIDGPLLSEFGLAGLLHDIGKVRMPPGILRKPEKLTPEEFAIMQRHPVDGARMLRRSPDIPPLVPLVAFEHHLRIDGSGYPRGAMRASLNLATVLTSIADVYDAMRSQRAYQQVFPSERVIEVLRRNDGHQFDQHLVRRFVQLVGIYPVGTTVRLDTGHVAVVLSANTSDAHRPRVCIVLDPDGRKLDERHEIDLWTVAADSGQPSTIAAPVDHETLGIDPVACL